MRLSEVLSFITYKTIILSAICVCCTFAASAENVAIVSDQFQPTYRDPDGSVSFCDAGYLMAPSPSSRLDLGGEFSNLGCYRIIRITSIANILLPLESRIVSLQSQIIAKLDEIEKEQKSSTNSGALDARLKSLEQQVNDLQRDLAVRAK